MNLSLSFSGDNAAQLPAPGAYGNTAVETVLFNQAQLQTDTWSMTWCNIAKATNLYGPENVTFHFPVNDSDYVADAFPRERLAEAYRRAGDLGLAGVVVHSNRIREADEWRKFDAAAERQRVGEMLSTIASSDASSDTWLGLENMPLVGVSGYETDPLFVCADDFEDLPGNVGIVWDVCHGLCSESYAAAFKDERIPSDLLARPIASVLFDPASLADRIVHWHFSASRGLNNPSMLTVCEEGVLPQEADMPASAYEAAMRQIAVMTGEQCAVNFEVQEQDYSQRVRGPAIIRWAQQILGR